MTTNHKYFLNLAFKIAEKNLGKTKLNPSVGAIVVKDGLIIATGRNRRETEQNPVAHAELIALQEASKVTGSWRLLGCTLYVTLEPCAMCAGALVLSRIDRLVFGCRDPKAGAVRSLFQVADDVRLNHNVEIVEGVLAESCSKLLTDFFSRLRNQTRRSQ